MILYETMSDLHVGQTTERADPWLFKGWDDCAFSIVAGDTARGAQSALDVLATMKATGRTLFFIDGNHEHYDNVGQGRTVVETEHLFFGKGHTGRRYTVPCEERIVAIGCNGWFHVDKEIEFWHRRRSEDRIGHVDQVNEAAKRHALWMDKELRCLQKHQKALVVTHTLPSIRLIRRKWQGAEGTEFVYNPFMEPVFEKHRNKILAWHHGHTHEVFVDRLFGVPVVCNPRGFSHNNHDNWVPWICGVRNNKGQKLSWRGRRSSGIFLPGLP